MSQVTARRPFDNPAAELHLSKTTLVEWNRAAQGGDLKEALQERMRVFHEVELHRLTARFNPIEAVLAQRQIDLFRIESILRAGCHGGGPS